MKKSVLMFSLLSGTALMFPRLTIASGLPALTHTYTPEPKPERGVRGNGKNVGYADKRACGIKAPQHQTIHTYQV